MVWSVSQWKCASRFKSSLQDWRLLRKELLHIRGEGKMLWDDIVDIEELCSTNCLLSIGNKFTELKASDDDILERIKDLYKRIKFLIAEAERNEGSLNRTEHFKAELGVISWSTLLSMLQEWSKMLYLENKSIQESSSSSWTYKEKRNSIIDESFGIFFNFF